MQVTLWMLPRACRVYGGLASGDYVFLVSAKKQ